MLSHIYHIYATTVSTLLVAFEQSTTYLSSKIWHIFSIHRTYISADKFDSTQFTSAFIKTKHWWHHARFPQYSIILCRKDITFLWCQFYGVSFHHCSLFSMNKVDNSVPFYQHSICTINIQNVQSRIQYCRYLTYDSLQGWFPRLDKTELGMIMYDHSLYTTDLLMTLLVQCNHFLYALICNLCNT